MISGHLGLHIWEAAQAQSATIVTESAAPANLIHHQARQLDLKTSQIYLSPHLPCHPKTKPHLLTETMLSFPECFPQALQPVLPTAAQVKFWCPHQTGSLLLKASQQLPFRRVPELHSTVSMPWCGLNSATTLLILPFLLHTSATHTSLSSFNRTSYFLPPGLSTCHLSA